MSNQLPLSYEAQRSIIPHLDVHLRINLSNRCRSLRILDSLLPLKIQNFQMNHNDFKINGIVYKIGIIKIWKKERGPTPNFVKEQNRVGGYPFDVNEYGLVPNLDTNAEFILNLNNELRVSKKTQLIRNDSAMLYRVLDENTMNSITLKQEDKIPPYTMYLQVLKIFDNGVRRRIRLQYNHKIQQTKDYIWSKIFGTQRLVRIQNFEVKKISVPSLVWKDYFGRTFNPFGASLHGAQDLHKYRIPCLPFDNRRLEIQKLELGNETFNFLDAIRPILIGSLKMVYSSNLEDPIVRASEFLITETGQIETLGDIPNPRVHMGNYMFNERKISTLVTQWKNGRSLIGVHYSFFYRSKSVESFLACFGRMDGARKELMDQLRGTLFPECIILPIKEDSEAIVYCEKSKTEDKEYCGSEYIIRIKIRGNGRGLGME